MHNLILIASITDNYSFFWPYQKQKHLNWRIFQGIRNINWRESFIIKIIQDSARLFLFYAAL